MLVSVLDIFNIDNESVLVFVIIHLFHFGIPFIETVAIFVMGTLKVCEKRSDVAINPYVSSG